MKNSYLVAILPPAEIAEKIEDIKSKILSEHSVVEHKAALPPHITILPSFKTDARGIQTFSEQLMEFIKANAFDNFTIVTTDFISLPNTNLSIDIEKNIELERLRRSLKLWLIDLKITPQKREKYLFLPHITLQNKFSRKSQFRELSQQFQSKVFREKFIFNALCLFEKLETKWELKQTFKC